MTSANGGPTMSARPVGWRIWLARRLASGVIFAPDSPKALRETLCIAQARIGNSPYDEHRKASDVARLGQIIDECDRLRPLGPDGKHGDRHTRWCGC